MSDIVERLRRFAAQDAGVAVLIDAATEIERLRAQLAAPADAKIRDALEDCRQFMVGQITPVTVGPFVGTISSNHPCHALIAKIDAALARSEEKGHG